MPTASQDQIKDRINSFVIELEKLVRKSTLEAIQGVLGDFSAPARGRPAGGRGPGRPKGSGGSRNVEGAAEAILAYVKDHDSESVSQVAAGAGVSLKVAKKVILKLVASGQLQKTGQKRGTRYHLGSGTPAPLATEGKTAKRGKRGRKKA